jgi:hypothetical protein
MPRCRFHVLAGAVIVRDPSRALRRCVLALALTLPGAAYPLSLHRLLQLPLEELLQLRITEPPDAPRSRVDRLSKPPGSSDRSRP